jgi:hypothetical protein
VPDIWRGGFVEQPGKDRARLHVQGHRSPRSSSKSRAAR